MSTLHRTWLALGLLAILLLVGACESTRNVSVTQGDAAQGRSLWLRSACVGCHGPNGEGSRAGPALANTPLTLREVIDITRRGGPGMPAYSASLISDEDLQDMYAWFQAPVLVPTAEPTAEPGEATPTGEPGQATPTGVPGQATAAVEQGQELWTNLGCGACHGPKAGGDSASALAGTSQAHTDFRNVVRQGAPGMPAYSETQVGDRGLEAVYAWLQAQPRAPALEGTVWLEMGCGGCHGADAEGASATGLAGKEFSYDEFQRVVRGGVEGMPAYGTSRIGDTDLQRMYDALMALP
jgi:mono/diheme cytochrome c family protein